MTSHQLPRADRAMLRACSSSSSSTASLSSARLAAIRAWALLLTALVLLGTVGLGTPSASAQDVSAEKAQATFDAVSIERDTFPQSPNFALYGPISVTIDGRTTKLPGTAQRAWLSPDSRMLVYTGPEGGGGYENEGQALWVVLANDPSQRFKAVATQLHIDDVAFVRNSTGQDTVVLQMSDGGLGAQHVSIVDPSRGQLALFRFSSFVGSAPDRILIAMYGNGDANIWESFGQTTLVRPQRVIPFKIDDLSAIPVQR